MIFPYFGNFTFTRTSWNESFLSSFYVESRRSLGWPQSKPSLATALIPTRWHSIGTGGARY